MKKLTVLLLSVMIASTFTSCASKDKTNTKTEDSAASSSKIETTSSEAAEDSADSSEQETAASEASSEQEDSSEDASAEDSEADSADEPELAESEAAEFEPISIPRSGWTEDSLRSVIYVNGVNAVPPCKFADLGEGYELVTDDEEYFDLTAKEAYAVLRYHGMDSIACVIKPCRDVSDVYDGNITMIEDELEFVEEPSISVNGFTLGMSMEEMEKLLGFETEKINTADGSDKYRASFTGHDLLIYIDLNEEGAYRIILYFPA